MTEFKIHGILQCFTEYEASLYFSYVKNTKAGEILSIKAKGFSEC